MYTLFDYLRPPTGNSAIMATLTRKVNMFRFFWFFDFFLENTVYIVQAEISSIHSKIQTSSMETLKDLQ